MSWRWLKILLVLSLLLTTQMGEMRTRAQDINAVIVPANVFPESKDYATTLLENAWDMNEFYDVSTLMQGAGHYPYLNSFSVQNGIFLGNTMYGYPGSNLSWHWVAHWGFPEGMLLENRMGMVNPIRPADYQCLYFAMKIDSPDWYPASPYPPDGFLVQWYSTINYAQQPMYKPNGATNLIYSYPEDVFVFPSSTLVTKWKLFKVNLNSPINGLIDPVNSAAWSSRPEGWQAFQFMPTTFANANFAIDWMRLTSCANDAQQQATITFSPSASLHAVWIRPAGTTRNIQVDTDISGWGTFNGSSGTYSLDTKGLMPGRYLVGVGDYNGAGIQWSASELVINQSVIPFFDRPSPYSGEDYAAAGGNAWDMDASDVKRTECMQSVAFTNGLMLMDTPNPLQIYPYCTGPHLPESDAKIYLNLPASLTMAREYRYLSFRLFMSGDYRLPAEGMMGRWIWTEDNNCVRVSVDIPYDVGWQTYTIDMYDDHNGTPAEASPSSCSLEQWDASSRVIELRFDPNENYTGPRPDGTQVVPAQTFHQEIDWIRLTKPDGVTAGSIFPIMLTLNKDAALLASINFYYTTDRANPKQHLIGSHLDPYVPQEVTPTDASAISSVYLPLITNHDASQPPLGPREVRYLWNTSGVPVGAYYICAESSDGYNTTVYCSDAVMTIR